MNFLPKPIAIARFEFLPAIDKSPPIIRYCDETTTIELIMRNRRELLKFTNEFLQQAMGHNEIVLELGGQRSRVEWGTTTMSINMYPPQPPEILYDCFQPHWRFKVPIHSTLIKNLFGVLGQAREWQEEQEQKQRNTELNPSPTAQVSVVPGQSPQTASCSLPVKPVVVSDTLLWFYERLGQTVTVNRGNVRELTILPENCGDVVPREP